MIDAALQELRERVGALLSRERLAANQIAHFDTPRRLAVLASGIPATQPDVTERMNGPSASVAYKDGQPTPAAHAFARKAGVDVSQLEKITTPKGEYLAASVTRKGRSAAEILAENLPKENFVDLLAEEYVLAQAERAFCAARALAGGDAGWRDHSAGIRRHPGRERITWAQDSVAW